MPQDKCNRDNTSQVSYEITALPVRQEHKQHHQIQHHRFQEQNTLQQQQQQNQSLCHNLVSDKFYTDADEFLLYQTHEDHSKMTSFQQQFNSISNRNYLTSATDPSFHPLRLNEDTISPFKSIDNIQMFENSVTCNYTNNNIDDPGYSAIDDINDSKALLEYTSSLADTYLQQKPRQGQDVFRELIALARSNADANSVFDMSLFQPGHTQYNISSNLQNQQNEKGTSSFSASLSQAAASTAILNARSAVKVKEIMHAPGYLDDKIYTISMAQQPSRARMCGFGDKDRRSISPAPIVKLTITSMNGMPIDPGNFDTSFLIVVCDTCQQDSLLQVINLPSTSLDGYVKEQSTEPRPRNLTGSLVSNANKLYDLSGNLGIYFVFQDVSLRIEGCFRLKFSLIDIGSSFTRNLNTSTVSHVLTTVQSDPFTVYTAKKFPGVVQTTLLSECFAKQGVKISIRKEKLGTLPMPGHIQQNH